MADIINLRRVRKARRRADDDKAAEINRAAFGRSRIECDVTAAEADRETRRFEAHRRTASDPDSGDAGD